MTEIDLATIAIRSVNLVLWVVLAWRVLHSDRVLSRLARRIVILVAVAGMGALFLGALAPYVMPFTMVRLIYTAFTTLAAIAALALLTTGEPHGPISVDATSRTS